MGTQRRVSGTSYVGVGRVSGARCPGGLGAPYGGAFLSVCLGRDSPLGGRNDGAGLRHYPHGPTRGGGRQKPLCADLSTPMVNVVDDPNPSSSRAVQMSSCGSGTSDLEPIAGYAPRLSRGAVAGTGGPCAPRPFASLPCRACVVPVGGAGRGLAGSRLSQWTAPMESYGRFRFRQRDTEKLRRFPCVEVRT
jgi:hypothetical protein